MGTTYPREGRVRRTSGVTKGRERCWQASTARRSLRWGRELRAALPVRRKYRVEQEQAFRTSARHVRQEGPLSRRLEIAGCRILQPARAMLYPEDHCRFLRAVRRERTS